MTKTEPVISIRGLSKQYGSHKALTNLSFEVCSGELFAFLGPNGAGKTTTIQIMTTLLAPSSGEVLIAGVDPIKNSQRVRENIGVVFQKPSLDDDLTARENMQIHCSLYKVPRAERKSRISDLLELVDLAERQHVPVKTFSGGMKRRLEIARSLLHRPRIVFLDEPTLGLDAQTRHAVWQYLKRLNEQEGTTVFFSTHYMEEAQSMASRIAVIDHGSLIAAGSSREIISATGATSLEQAYLELTGTDTRDNPSEGRWERAMGAL